MLATAVCQTVKLGGQDQESQSIDWTSLSKSPRPMLNIPLVSDREDDGYVKFELLQSFQPQLGSSSITSTFSSSDSKQESSPDSSDDHIYEQLPFEHILQIMPSGKCRI